MSAAENKAPGRGDGAGAVLQGTDAAKDTPRAAMPQGCAWGRYEVVFNGQRHSRYETPLEAEIVASWLRSLGWRAHAIDRAPAECRFSPHQPDLFKD